MRPYALSVLLFVLPALWGCSNPCEEALDHVNECLQLDSPATEEEPPCEDVAECEAECALEAPCEAFIDSLSVAAEDYRLCVDGC